MYALKYRENVRMYGKGSSCIMFIYVRVRRTLCVYGEHVYVLYMGGGDIIMYKYIGSVYVIIERVVVCVF